MITSLSNKIPSLNKEVKIIWLVDIVVKSIWLDDFHPLVAIAPRTMEYEWSILKYKVHLVEKFGTFWQVYFCCKSTKYKSTKSTIEIPDKMDPNN